MLWVDGDVEISIEEQSALLIVSNCRATNCYECN